MKVPLLDLHRQNGPLKKEFLMAFERVLNGQRFILGEELETFESNITSHTDCQFALGVSSGTDALLLALMALGLKAGDEIITTPYTFFATVGAILRMGATPIFVDIDPNTFNVDPDLIEKKITSKTKAIIVVHLFGQCCDMKKICSLAQNYNLSIVEDAAQSIESTFLGHKAGGIGDIGCFSFFPSKNLGALGDAGLVSTNNEEIFHKMKKIRNHGASPKYYHKFVGGNFRMDALQASFLNVKLKHLDSYIQKRIEHAAIYESFFKDYGQKKGTEYTLKIKLPTKYSCDSKHVYNQYVIKTKKRDELKKFLSLNDIESEIYYPLPMHLQECLANYNYAIGDFPMAEICSQTSLALPIYEGLSNQEIEYVVNKIFDFFQSDNQ
ncbi:MAG: DegT/DnrJ/EryC1/StrS family aminotransferase [Oligoflexia bacterium]|nr:DegT/DnrJ/EryC1/StrS family aminotransferase [Oligoflexia bacterium]